MNKCNFSSSSFLFQFLISNVFHDRTIKVSIRIQIEMAVTCKIQVKRRNAIKWDLETVMVTYLWWKHVKNEQAMNVLAFHFSVYRFERSNNNTSLWTPIENAFQNLNFACDFEASLWLQLDFLFSIVVT